MRHFFFPSRRRSNGFTLLEVLLVVAAIAILAGIVIFAINPARQLAKLRNAQRVADVSLIMDAVYQYTIENNGVLPTNIPDWNGTSCLERQDVEICVSADVNSCSVNISELMTNQRYLTEMPIDPQGFLHDADGNGYHILKSEHGRIIVCAPKAELGETIQKEK